MGKFGLWLSAIICVSIVARVIFYLVYKGFWGVGLVPADLVAIPIGLVCGYLAWAYLRKIRRLSRRTALEG